MKVAIVLVFLIAFAVCVEESQILEQFKKFMVDFNKDYDSQSELRIRLNNFKSNLQIIEDLNAESASATFGITKFADMTPQEFKATYLGTKIPNWRDPTWPVAAPYSDDFIKAMPTAFDWRSKGAVTPVKNQGQCGSCWAFSSTGNMEGIWNISGNPLVGLSEQNLVDCDHHCMQYEGESVCDAGCDGGLMPNAFQYVIGNGGIDTENSYGYQGEDGSCHFKSANIGAKFSNWNMVSGNETQMAAYLFANGPISIAVDAEEWQFYIGGVFDFPWCGESLDHGVLIVGYGVETDWFDEPLDFWVIKNSWGGDWGEDGYIRLERGNSECGDDLFPCSIVA